MSESPIVEVLLVEDHPQDPELTIRALKKHRLANQLFHVQDAAQVLDFLERGKCGDCQSDAAPEVILIDLKLPRVSRLEGLRRMKSDPYLSTIPVVIGTSSVEDPDIQAAYRLGANRFMFKPVQFDAFMETMSKLGIYRLLLNRPLHKP